VKRSTYLAGSLAALALAGCSSTHGEQRSSPAPSVRSTTAVTSTPASSAAPVPATSAATAASALPATTPTTARCHTASLRAGPLTAVPNPPPVAYRIPLTNTGVSACTIYGWPGVSFRDAAGADVADATRTGTNPQTQTLAAGASATFVLVLTNPAGGNGCVAPVPTTAHFVITPPDETASLPVDLPGSDPICHPYVYPVGTTAPN
jgi:hypothetical protein